VGSPVCPFRRRFIASPPPSKPVPQKYPKKVIGFTPTCCTMNTVMKNCSLNTVISHNQASESKRTTASQTHMRTGTNKYSMKKLLAVTLIMGAMLASSRAAVITITVQGTVTQAQGGWNLGDPVSFTWALSGTAPYKGTANWYENGPGTPPMFTDVTGTGLQGTYAAPNWRNSTISLPRAQDNTSGDYLYLSSEVDGLSAPNNNEVLTLVIGFTSASFDFPLSSPLPEPGAFFGSLLGPSGEYSTSGSIGSGLVKLWTGSGMPEMGFDLTSISIVPEPSEWAAMSFGVLGIVWVVKRRFMPVRA